MLRLGDTFLLPTPRQNTPHLWIVITEPDAEGKAICLNITTRQPFSETTVVLNAGDHPFITHESVVYYSDARSLDVRIVEEAMKGQHGFVDIVCQQHEPCSVQLLRRIQGGLLASPFVKRKIKDYCRALWNR